MMMEYESRGTVGTWRGLLYRVRRKNWETNSTEMDEAGSTEYETTMLSENFSNSKKLSHF